MNEYAYINVAPLGSAEEVPTSLKFVIFAAKSSTRYIQVVFFIKIYFLDISL